MTDFCSSMSRWWQSCPKIIEQGPVPLIPWPIPSASGCVILRQVPSLPRKWRSGFSRRVPTSYSEGGVAVLWGELFLWDSSPSCAMKLETVFGEVQTVAAWSPPCRPQVTKVERHAEDVGDRNHRSRKVLWIKASFPISIADFWTWCKPSRWGSMCIVLNCY
jgi:hypothetical protein